MKNKKLLVLVLAAFSLSAVGAFAATGCDPEETKPQHEHTYTWQSTADGHSGTCECGDEKVTEPHVDVKNNATGENGKDGKCDVCDYEIKQVVSFNVLGHGTAPDALNVSFGDKVTKPADLEEDGYNFLGWYKDADGNTEFDFDDPITGDTVIYAKWEENTTPGETAKYAHVLTLGEPNPHVLGSKGYSYYKYTATETGRYQIDLGLGVNNAKCSFTTDLDDGVYGNGQDVSTKYFDLDAEASVIIKLSCSEALPADAAVSVIVSQVTNEALPADGWFSGLYTNGSTMFIFDRESKQMRYEGVDDAYGCNYIGGSFDTLTFQQGTGIYANNYKFVRKGDGVYEVISTGSTKATTFVCYPEVEGDFATANLAGIYALADGEDGKGLTDVVIREDGKGFYVKDGKSTNVNQAVAYEEYGMLIFGDNANGYLISINEKEGDNVSIKVYSSDLGGFVTFERTGDLVDTEHSKLPITVSSGSKEYAGSKFSVTVKSATQSWGSGVLLVTAFDETSNTYTIRADGQNYKLTVTGDGDEAEIKVYDEAGTLLDTLTKFVEVVHDLPTEANTTVTLPKEDFKKYFYFFKATESGWYSFNNTNENIEIYYDLPGYDHYDTEGVKTINGSQTVYLEADAIIGVKNVYEGEMPASVTFTVGLSNAPQGRSEDNPIVLTETTTIESADRSNPYYFEISTPGSYIITCSQDVSSSGDKYKVWFTVNGTKYGWAMGNRGLAWTGGIDASSPYVHITVEDGQKASIVVYREYSMVKYADLTIMLAEDYSVTGNDLTIPEGLNSLTLENGKYKAASSSLGEVTGIKLTSTSDFTVICGGVTYTDTVITLSSSKLALGFKIEAGSAAVSYTSVYKEGTQYNPKVIEKVGTQTNLTAKYLSITAPEDKDLLLTSYYGSNNFFYVTYNGVNYGFNYVDGKYVPFENSTLKIPKGQTVVVTVHCANPDYTTGTCDLDLAYDFTEEAIELDKLDSFTKTTAANGSMTITATYELTGTKNFCIPAIYGSKLTISCASGSNFDVLTRLGYTKNAKVLTYNLNDNSALQKLGYEGGDIYFRLSAENATTITFTQTLTAGSVCANPKEVSFATSATWTQAVSETMRYFKLPAGGYNVSYSGPTSTTPKGYLILNGNVVENNTFITVEDGDVLIYKYSYAADSVTFKLPSIAQEYRGIFTYTDGETVKKAIIGESTLTVDGVAYVLNEIDGNNYTYKHESDTLTLTLGDNGTMSIGGNELTAYVMFTEEQAKTYTGTLTVGSNIAEVTLKLNQDGTAEYAIMSVKSTSAPKLDSQLYNVMVSESEGTYSFTYKNINVTFTFNEDGSLAVNDATRGSLTLTKAGIYSGTVGEFNITLTFNGDLTKVSMYLVDMDEYYRNMTVSVTDGVYSFADLPHDIDATFTISGDTINITFDGIGSGALTDVDAVLPDFNYSGEGVSIETQGESGVYIVGGDDFPLTFVSRAGNVYVYSYSTKHTVTLTVSEDGTSATLVDSYDHVEVPLTKQS